MSTLHAATRLPPPAATVPDPSPTPAAPLSLGRQRLQAPTRAATSRREGWLLAALVVAVHGALLYWAVQRPTPTLPVVPPEVPPMTIEFSQPAPPPPIETPPPPPVVQPPEPPPPPVVDELASKPPPKPKPKPVKKEPPPPKPVPKQEAKPVVPAPVPPKAEAPPAPPTPPAPPAPKPLTPPSASAGYLKNPAPEYPSLAQRRGWEGTVLLRVHVAASGSPLEVQVQQSAGRQQLDDAAVAAVKRWSFVPAKQGDQAVDGWVTVPIDFKIR